MTEPLDTGVAHNARVWNFWLGGKDHYAADRVAGERVQAMFPSIAQVAQADRAFLGRVVRWLAGPAGITQFLDVGTGLPTADNTHQVAQQVNPAARVVYVDNDPLVLAHARALLTSTPQGATAYLDADAYRPEDILAAAAETLDLTRPVAVMMLGVVNFLLDQDAARHSVTTLLGGVGPGSYLALTHPTLELGGEGNVEAMAFWNAHATPPIRARSRTELLELLDGLQLLEPGLVSATRWRPDTVEVGCVETVPHYAVLGYKP